MQICNFNGSRSNYIQIRVFPPQYKDFYKLVKDRFQIDYPGEVAFDMFYKKKNEETHILVSSQASYSQCLVDFTIKNFTRLYYSPKQLNESVRPSDLLNIKAENKDKPEIMHDLKQKFIDRFDFALKESQKIEENPNNNTKNNTNNESLEKKFEAFASKLKIGRDESADLSKIEEEDNENLKQSQILKKEGEGEPKENNQILEELWKKPETAEERKNNDNYSPDKRLPTTRPEFEMPSKIKCSSSFRKDIEETLWDIMKESIPDLSKEIVRKLEKEDQKSKNKKNEEISQSFFGLRSYEIINKK